MSTSEDNFSLVDAAEGLNEIRNNLKKNGYALINQVGLIQLSGISKESLDAIEPTWNDLPSDAYLKDGGHYRRRRHTSFVLDQSQFTLHPHRAHWQPVSYNALHGGLERWYEPLQQDVANSLALTSIALWLYEVVAPLSAHKKWFGEAHQFRIDTTGGIGRPTPEGAHRDGVDWVAVILVKRKNIKGGETRVFETNGPTGFRFQMMEPWTVLLMDDKRVIHETTPIQPTTDVGYRDTLVLTLRGDGFLEEKSPN